MKLKLTILLTFLVLIGFGQVKNYTIEGTKWVKTPKLILSNDTAKVKELGDTLLTTEKWRDLSGLIKSGYDSSKFNVLDGYVYNYIGASVVDSFLLDGRYKLLSDTSYNAVYDDGLAVTPPNISISYPLEFDSTDYNLWLFPYYILTEGSDEYEVGTTYSNKVKTTTGFTCEVSAQTTHLRYLAIDSTGASCLDNEKDPVFLASVASKITTSDTIYWNAKANIDTIYDIISTIPTGGVKSWYFTKTASDIGGYYLAQDTLPTNAIQSIISTATDGESTVAEFLTPRKDYIVNDGNRFFYLSAKVSDETKGVRLRGEVYTCDTLGNNRVLLRTSSTSTELTELMTQVITNAYGNALIIEDTVRVIFKVVAIKADPTGTDPVVTLYVCDDTFTRLDVPVPVPAPLLETDPEYAADSSIIVKSPVAGVSGRLAAYTGANTIDSTAWRINGRNLGYGIAPTSTFQIEGLGQTTPLMTISNDKNATKDSTFTVLPNGYVGIGKSTPLYMVDVLGDIAFSNALIYSSNANLDTKLSGTSTGRAFRFITSSAGARLQAIGSTSSDLSFSTTVTGSEAVRFTIKEGGNVGIGTIVPDKKLEINQPTAGAAIRIAYNDANGSAADYFDLGIEADGDGTLAVASGDTIKIGTPTTINNKMVNLYGSDYAEMYMYDNVTACVIDNADVYHAVLNSFGNNDGILAPNIDVSCFTYKAGASYTIASVATYNAGTQIQCTVTAGHSLLAGEPITITNSTNYNGTYLVQAAGLTATEFVVTKAYVATNTGSARKPATLKVLKTGIYNAEFSGGGVTVSANDVIKMELNKNLVPLDNISRKVEWTTNNRMIGSSGLVSCTANDYIWLSVKNTSGTGDLTINSMNVKLIRK